MLAQHDLSLYLTTAKNNTNSTPDLHRETEGGRTTERVGGEGEGEGGDDRMRRRQTEKTSHSERKRRGD